MADDAFIEVYSNSGVNAEIAATASEFFGNTTSDRQAKLKYGSFNTLLITSLSGQNCRITLDGNSSRILAQLKGSGSCNIDAKDGIFFDFVQIQNLDAAAVISASDVTVRYGISKPRTRIKTFFSS